WLRAGRVFLTLALLLAVLAALIGRFLGDPYHAIGDAVVHLAFVMYLSVPLRTCLRLAKGSEYAAKLYGVTFGFVLTVLTLVGHLVAVLDTQHRDYNLFQVTGV